MPWLAPFADAEMPTPQTADTLDLKVAMPWLAPFADA